MVGRRGRGGAGRPTSSSNAKRATPQNSKKTSTDDSRSASASPQLQAALMQTSSYRHTASGVKAAAGGLEEEEEVTLVYRKPRSAKHTSSLSSAAPERGGAPAVPTTGHTPEEEILGFWRRACGDNNCIRALSDCGVQGAPLWEDPPKPPAPSSSALTTQQILTCPRDRMETALRALINLEQLLYSPAPTDATSGSPVVGYPCWVRAEHYAAVVALARLCEAAVPLGLPSLLVAFPVGVIGKTPTAATQISARVLGSNGAALLWRIPQKVFAETTRNAPTAPVHSDCDEQLQAPLAVSTTEDMVDCLPSPVLLSSVRKRYRALQRIRQIRKVCTELFPVFRSASTGAEVRHTFFAHDETACRTLGRLCVASKGENTHAPHFLAPGVTGECGGTICRGSAVEAEALSCFLGNPLVLDVLIPFAGITARHPLEEALLKSFVTQLTNMTAVDAATWGPMVAMTSWRCTEGIYVVQHATRVHTLRRLLEEAEFYGLPRFLRSIRAMAGNHLPSSGAADASAAAFGWSVEEWFGAAGLRRAQESYPDQFFLTPDGLDPAVFCRPDPMQAQVVQEELVTLQRTHCVFCLLVGEADAVLQLVHEHMRCVGRAWQRCIKTEAKPSSLVKDECMDYEDDPNETGEGRFFEDAADRAPRQSFVDPLHRYVMRTVDAAQRRQGPLEAATPSSPSGAAPAPFSHVQWIEQGGKNYWHSNANYYGVVYMVVLETKDEWSAEAGSVTTEQLLPGTVIPVTEGTDVNAFQQTRAPAYCINAIVELWRS